MARKRRVKSVKTELVKKAREAMLAAVQLYNIFQEYTEPSMLSPNLTYPSVLTAIRNCGAISSFPFQ